MPDIENKTKDANEEEQPVSAEPSETATSADIKRKPWYAKVGKFVLIAILYVVLEKILSATLGKSTIGSAILYIIVLIFVIVQIFR